MKSSRRNFLAAGLSMPVAGLASVPSAQTATRPPELKSGGLQYRTLGKTGLKVTTVAFGCMITSDQSVVEKAADIGINYFDTARGYQGGQNEKMVGAALKSKRKQLYISSKTQARTKEDAIKHLETSLTELGTDYLDIWYLHARSRAEDLTDELLDAQQTAKQQGKIRFAGVSTHSGQAEIIGAAIKCGKIDVVDLAYNFSMAANLDAAIDAAIDAATEAKIGLVAMKVMAGGMRRAKPGTPLGEILQREGAMTAALKWVLKNPKIHTTIPSMTDMDQLDANFKAMSASFTDTDQKVLVAHLRRIGPTYCRMCGECEGTCPKGLPVADMLRFLTYADGYGEFALGRERFLELPADVQAIRCGDCAECKVSCPYGVRVTERLIRSQELFA